MVDPIDRLIAEFRALPTVRRVHDAIELCSQRKVGGLWGGSAALLLATALKGHTGRVLIATADDVDSLQLQADLACFRVEAAVLPRQETDDQGLPDAQTRSERHKALSAAARPRSTMLGSIDALLQKAPARKALQQGRIVLQKAQELQRDSLLQLAAAAGLRAVPLVLAPGEVSVRGDVLDVFPLGADAAVRLEFFDRTVESIRTFDPATQRTVEVLDRVELQLGGVADLVDDATVLSHLEQQNLLVVFYEPLRIEQRTSLLASFDSGFGRGLNALNDSLRTCAQLSLSALPSHDLDLKILSAGSAVGSGEADPIGRLRSVRGLQGRVLLLCRTDSERQRQLEIFAHKQIDLAQEQVTVQLGTISRGFRVPELSCTVLSNVEFAGVPHQARVRERTAVPSRAIQSFFELGPGDYVVHAVHGIARFLGMELVERGEGAEDHLRLSFHDEVTLLVPASKIHLVQKYVGSHSGIALDKLGGKGFQRRKEQVQEALFDMAADLLEVQAARARIQRPAHQPDATERDFQDAFPFRDTADQATAWQEIRTDLEKPMPMDRLLCGDVGFGKTEVALRAVFRVAMHGRQVAVLVPTTILAEQHWHTFSDRCRPFGIEVELLSRYRTKKERDEVHDRMLRGQVDIVVGTHQILGSKVEWKDLALIVVDEEQRFGVRQKERLKQLRTDVDVLTLSATPIPRTLHSSLLGIRAISTLTTPPPGRQDVETRVVFRDDHLLQEALQRELGRGGQVFYLHNKIADLQIIATRLRQLVPQARVAIGHGQMDEEEVERTVRAFVRGEFDILVSTTIVENGLDLPRANTILIDRADQFGLGELHQLRGRVGRSDKKAWCFLMLDHDAPPTDVAKKRLKALEELSQLGAGFAIAMKDLEIRGAGNLLGPQQSGHIAAVGYDMYCQLLQQAVQAHKDQRKTAHAVIEVDVDLRLRAYLPDKFLADPRGRLELLREMDAAVDDEHLQKLQQELRDRFGALPAPVQNLLATFRLKHALQGLGLSSIQWVEDDRIVVRHPPGVPLGGSWLDCFTDVRPVEAGRTHLMLPAPRGKKRRGEDVLEFLLDALSGRAPAQKMRRR